MIFMFNGINVNRGIDRYLLLGLLIAFLGQNNLFASLSQSQNPQMPDSFFLAIDIGDNEMLQSLCQTSANLEIKDTKGFTPLMYARFKNNKKAEEILIKAGARPLNRFERMKIFARSQVEQRYFAPLLACVTGMIIMRIAHHYHEKPYKDLRAIKDALPSRLSEFARQGKTKEFEQAVQEFSTKNDALEKFITAQDIFANDYPSDPNFTVLDEICNSSLSSNRMKEMIAQYFKYFTISSERFNKLFFSVLKNAQLNHIEQEKQRIYLIARFLLEQSNNVNRPKQRPNGIDNGASLGMDFCEQYKGDVEAVDVIAKALHYSYEDGRTLLEIIQERGLYTLGVNLIKLCLNADKQIDLSKKFISPQKAFVIDFVTNMLVDYFSTDVDVDKILEKIDKCFKLTLQNSQCLKAKLTKILAEFSSNSKEEVKKLLRNQVAALLKTGALINSD